MHDAALLRKISEPTLPATLLHRTHLLTQLQEALTPDARLDGISLHHKLVLSCAPAGYGKTTLLADFARVTPFLCCWYFLDQTDTDPVVFLRTLLASIQHVFPHFGVSLHPLFDRLVSKEASLARSFYHFLIEALCAACATELTAPFALILSNYEEINESETLADLVNMLLAKLPPQAALIIESRVIPDLSFASLVIRDEICGLHTGMLRFSAQEISDLTSLQGLPVLTAEEAEQLATSFDGWIAGILLGTRIGQARFRMSIQQTAQSGHLPEHQVKAIAEHQKKMLFEYVVEEVFKQDRAATTFVQMLSILQQIEPALCNALLDITDAAEQLLHLERLGIFLSSQESSSGVIYRCHPAIRELLSERLRRQEPAQFLVLHRKAAAIWRAAHNEEQAIYHALSGEDYDLAASLILDASERLLQQGQRETVLRWLHALPETLQENHPRVLVLRATLHLERGQQGLALALLSKAAELVPEATTTEMSIFQANIAILQSKALFQTGAYAQAEALCQQVLLSLPQQEQALRAAAEMRLGICANLQGQFLNGITHLRQALAIWANHPPLNQAIDIHSSLANTYYLIGNPHLAQHHLQVMLEGCEQIQDMVGKGNALILQGLIAQDQGLMSEAEAHFLQVLALSRSPDMERSRAYALVNLSSLCIEQGHYSQALTYAQEGLALARAVGNRSAINDALSSLALGYVLLGDPTSALFMVEQMDAPEQAGYERAWHDLTLGLILLRQKRYIEADACLTKIEAILHTTDLKRPRFRAKLRLAACRAAQGHPEQAASLLEDVASLLTMHPGSLHLVQTEVQWMPVLLSVIRTHQSLTSLRKQLDLAESPHAEHEQISSALVDVPAPPTRSMTISAFGEPMVVLDGQPIKHWRMARAQELFFFLLNAGRSCSKEAILAAVWPEYDEQAANSFRNTMYQLRKLFGEASIILNPAGYHLDLTACYGDQVFYDVQAFQRYWDEAQQALTLTDTAHAKDMLLKMVKLYQGDYGRPFYNEWCTVVRDKLRTIYLGVHHQLAQIAWQAEDWNESAEYWREMLRLDNCLEEAHYGLMRCYLKQGKRGAALRQYQSCQEILQQELGVQPGQAIQNLYHRLTTA